MQKNSPVMLVSLLGLIALLLFYLSQMYRVSNTNALNCVENHTGSKSDNLALLASTPAHITAYDFDTFAFAGQSNAKGHFLTTGWNILRPTGKQVFEAQILANSGFATKAIDVARNGSASNENAAEHGLYWWNISENKPGPLLNNAVTAINKCLSAGQNLDGVIWAQGESDVYAILYSENSDVANIEADFVKATTNIFSYFRSNFGTDLPIFVQEIGYFTPPSDAVSNLNSFEVIRNAQLTIINADNNSYLAAKTKGLGHKDEIHFNSKAHGIIARRLADTAYVTVSSKP